MRVYKIENTYIDLDHVLCVTELEFKKYMVEGENYEASFYVSLAFQENHKLFGYHFPWDVEFFIVEEEKEKIVKKYNDFLNAWQNKPSVVIPDPLPTIQVRTGKPGRKWMS